MLVLLLSSLLLVPTWPLDFWRNTLAYASYIQFGTPLENLLHYFLPAQLAEPLTLILSGLFFLALLPGWWLAWHTRPASAGFSSARQASPARTVMSRYDPNDRFGA